MKKSNRERKLGLMVIPDGPRESRTFYVSYGALSVLAAISVVMVIGLVIVVGSWSYFAARALRATSLEAEVEAMAGDRVRLEILGQRLEIIEEQYGRMRDLLGYASSDELSNVCSCIVKQFIDDFSWEEYQDMLNIRITNENNLELSDRLQTYISSVMKECKISL